MIEEKTSRLMTVLLTSFLFGVLVGWCLLRTIQSVSFGGSTTEKDLKESLNRIEEISGRIDTVYEESIIWRDSIRDIVRWKEIAVDSVRRLPLDESLILLQENLKRYENDKKN